MKRQIYLKYLMVTTVLFGSLLTARSEAATSYCLCTAGPAANPSSGSTYSFSSPTYDLVYFTTSPDRPVPARNVIHNTPSSEACNVELEAIIQAGMCAPKPEKVQQVALRACKAQYLYKEEQNYYRKLGQCL